MAEGWVLGKDGTMAPTVHLRVELSRMAPYQAWYSGKSLFEEA
jgi:hypothetical protein